LFDAQPFPRLACEGKLLDALQEKENREGEGNPTMQDGQKELIADKRTERRTGEKRVRTSAGICPKGGKDSSSDSHHRGLLKRFAKAPEIR